MGEIIGMNVPTPSYRRMMQFIDGENLVFTFQKMCSQGFEPLEHIKHFKNTYVWNEKTVPQNLHIILRANYYTYAVGTETIIRDIRTQIKELSFRTIGSAAIPNNLTPIVFKKEKKSKKTKGVDIKMTVDILTQSYNDNLDTVFLIAGDGDYLPIIKEIKRLGKLVYLAFFTVGLNEELKYHVDKFIPLDNLYFESRD